MLTFFKILYIKYINQIRKKDQAYAEIINQQRGEVVLENKRIWLTNTYNAKHLNGFVRGQLRDEITKRVIVNGETGSSWHFKRFERLNLIFIPVSDAKLITS